MNEIIKEHFLYLEDAKILIILDSKKKMSNKKLSLTMLRDALRDEDIKRIPLSGQQKGTPGDRKKNLTEAREGIRAKVIPIGIELGSSGQSLAVSSNPVPSIAHFESLPYFLTPANRQ